MPENLTDPALDTLQSVAALHARNERSVSRPQRLIEAAIATVGRPRFLVGTLLFVGVWMFFDALASHDHLPHPDDPPYNLLQGILTFAALLLSIMILIAQNRQALIAERRAQLDLQISLLADQKSGKIIALLEELRRDLPQVRDRVDREAEQMQEAADPEAMLVALDYVLTEAATAADRRGNSAEGDLLREEVEEIDEALAELKAAQRA